MNFKNYLSEAETPTKVKYKLTKNSAINNILLVESGIVYKVVRDIRNGGKEDGFDIDEGDIYFTHIEPLQNGNFKLRAVVVAIYEGGDASLDNYECTVDANTNIKNTVYEQNSPKTEKECRKLASEQGIRILDL